LDRANPWPASRTGQKAKIAGQEAGQCSPRKGGMSDEQFEKLIEKLESISMQIAILRWTISVPTMIGLGILAAKFLNGFIW
jgi:hypothetical protein